MKYTQASFIAFFFIIQESLSFLLFKKTMRPIISLLKHSRSLSAFSTQHGIVIPSKVKVSVKRKSVMCLFSTAAFVNPNTSEKTLSIKDTSLGSESASHLLKGLDVYSVPADDGHPLSVYGINSNELEYSNDGKVRRPVLLLHGRTWSSVPVYHLMGGRNDKEKSRSLMETLYDAGLQPYCIDFRGFGGTPMDSTHSVIPNRCVNDAECALEFIMDRHDDVLDEEHTIDSEPQHLPVLLGWSQGALVAQLLAQKSPEMISKLVLYGSIYDPLVRYARSPLFLNGTDASEDRPKNSYDSAIEDFTVEGSIEPEPAAQFAKAALLTDPYNAPWKQLFQFNNVDPARVHVPTLVVSCYLYSKAILISLNFKLTRALNLNGQ